MKIDRRTAVVTGASSGIGKETAMKLALLGYSVIAVARRLDRLKALSEKVKGIIPYQCDLSSPGKVDEFCRYVSNLKNPVSVLINNAGYGIRGAIEEVDVGEAKNLFQVNFFSFIQITAACLPGMRKKKNGVIVNVSSIAGKVAFPMSGIYAASKHAVEAVTDALRLEVRPFGIRVIAIRPGSIATEFNNMLKALSDDTHAGTSGYYQKYHKKLQDNFRKLFANKTMPGPGLIADIIIEAVQSASPKAVYPAGFIMEEFMGARSMMDDEKFHGFMMEKTGLEEMSGSDSPGKQESGHNFILNNSHEAREEYHYGKLFINVNLSRREKEVLSHLVKGLTNRGISREMGIKTSTVKSHVDNIFNKMGVNDRTLASVLAILNNLVS